MLLPLPLTLLERQRTPPGWGVWEEAPLGLVFSFQRRGTNVPKEWEFGMPKGAERDGGVVVRELGTGLVVGATGSRDEIMDSRWRQEWPSNHPKPLGLEFPLLQEMRQAVTFLVGSPKKNFFIPESLKLEISFSGRGKGFLRKRCRSGEGKPTLLPGVRVTAGFGQSQRAFCFPLSELLGAIPSQPGPKRAGSSQLGAGG